MNMYLLITSSLCRHFENGASSRFPRMCIQSMSAFKGIVSRDEYNGQIQALFSMSSFKKV